MPQPSLLLTGFEPFGGDDINPSWQVAQALHGECLAGLQVQALQLPCVFGQALLELDAALARHRPLLVLSLGLAAGRCDLQLERVAINVDDARIPDNAGAAPVDEPVVPGGPAAYFSTLPIKAMVAAMRAAAVPASVSQSAGTYVCNHVFYGLMHRLAQPAGAAATSGGPHGYAARGGFMHLPLLPQQAAQRTGANPSLPLELMVQGVRVALHAAVHTQQDLRATGGSVA